MVSEFFKDINLQSTDQAISLFILLWVGGGGGGILHYKDPTKTEGGGGGDLKDFQHVQKILF